jgi:hypothetical protein
VSEGEGGHDDDSSSFSGESSIEPEDEADGTKEAIRPQKATTEAESEPERETDMVAALVRGKDRMTKKEKKRLKNKKLAAPPPPPP